MCTPPDNDLGYPYRADFVENTVAEKTYQLFSWAAFKVSCPDPQEYSEWTDRGRTRVSHDEFASYLRWAFERAGNAPKIANVSKLIPQADGWRLEAHTATTSANFGPLRRRGRLRAWRCPAEPPDPCRRLLQRGQFLAVDQTDRGNSAPKPDWNNRGIWWWRNRGGNPRVVREIGFRGLPNPVADQPSHALYAGEQFFRATVVYRCRCLESAFPFKSTRVRQPPQQRGSVGHDGRPDLAA